MYLFLVLPLVQHVQIIVIFYLVHNKLYDYRNHEVHTYFQFLGPDTFQSRDTVFTKNTTHFGKEMLRIHTYIFSF